MSIFDETIRVSQSVFSNYKTIQQAIDSAPVGAEIYIEEGTYNEELVITKHVKLLGIGNAEMVRLIGMNAETITIDNVCVQLHNMTIVNDGEHIAVNVKAHSSIDMTNCFVTAKVQSGIYFAEGAATSKIAYSHIHKTGSAAIFAKKATGIVITACHIAHNRSNAIIARNHAHVVIKDSHIYDNQFSSIVATTNAQVQVENSHIYNGAQHGIWVKEHGHVDVKNSHIYRHHFMNVTIETEGTVAIEKSHIYEGQQIGIWAKDKGKAFVTKTAIYGHTQSNAGAKTEGQITLDTCDVYNGEQNGIWVEEKGHIDIKASKIYRNQTPNIQVSTEGVIHISKSKIYESAQNGIWVSKGGQVQLQHSAVYQNAYGNVAIATEGRAVIEHSEIFAGQQSGIWAKEQAHVTVNDSRIYANKKANLNVETAATVMVQNSALYEAGDKGIWAKEHGRVDVVTSKIYNNGNGNIEAATNATITLTQSEIYESAKTGIWVREKGHVHVTDSTVHRNQYSNIGAMSEGRVTVERTNIYASEQSGVWAKDKGHIEVRDSRIYDNQKTNVNAQTNSVIRIERSHLYNSAQTNVIASEQGHVDVTDSYLYKAGDKYANVLSTKESQINLANSHVYDNPSYALWVKEKASMHVINSDVYDNAGMQIVLDKEGHITMENSRVYNGHKQGIWVKGGSILNAQDSEFYRNAETEQLYIQGDSRVQLTDTRIYEARNYGIGVNASALTLTNTTIADYTDVAIHETGGAQVVTHDTQPSNKPIVADTVMLQPTSELEKLQQLTGLTNLKSQIMQFVNSVKFNQRRAEEGLQVTPITLHSMFLGNPGTGKTTVARMLGNILYEAGVIQTDTFIEVSRKDLVAQYIGHTAKKTQEVLEQAQGGILFIDEAYGLYKDSDNDFGSEAIDTMLKFMEDNRDSIMIIFAGYTKEMHDFLSMNSGLASRIPNTFIFDDYTSSEIAQIGYTELMKQQYFVDEKLYTDIVTSQYERSIEKSNARWVRNFNEKVKMTMANRVIETDDADTQTIVATDLQEAAGRKVENKEQKMNELLAELRSLTGLANIKVYVERLVKQIKLDQLLMNEDHYEQQQPTYHMVFEGNPGTGKTTVARILGELFYYLDILPTKTLNIVQRADLIGAFVGQTEEKTIKILKQSMGGVLFIDEAYQLNNGFEHDFGKQAVEALLTYLEDYRDKFIVILAGYTNEMEAFLNINPGLRSRIPTKLVFPDYTPAEISTIVQTSIQKQWLVDAEYLQQKVIACYEALPVEEKSNARWARNKVEALIQNHKVWVMDNNVDLTALKHIQPVVIDETFSLS